MNIILICIWFNDLVSEEVKALRFGRFIYLQSDILKLIEIYVL